MDLERRVMELERTLVIERRASRRARRGLALAMCSVLLIAASEPLKTMYASRIEVGQRDAPSIVLGDSADGPSLRLRDADGFVATLTARGLAIAAPEPIEVPTLEEPGLGDAETNPDTTARVIVQGGASSIEVTCPALSHRERTQIVGGVALVTVPDAADCFAYVRGGKYIGRFTVKPGRDYVCDGGPDPACRQQLEPR